MQAIDINEVEDQDGQGFGGRVSRWAAHPIVLKELRGRMRGSRAFVVVTAHLAFLGFGLGLVYLTFFATSTVQYSADTRQLLGKALFGVVVGMELLLVSLIAPALTVGAISSERERQTFDLLRVTLLPARAVIHGKLLAALAFLALLLFSALPFQSLAFLFGGVSLEEIGISILILVVSAVFFSTLGIFFSSLVRRTLVGTVLCYALTILIVFGLPIMILVVSLFFNPVIGTILDRASQFFEFALVTGAWLLVALNPISASIATETLLVGERSIFYYRLSLPAGGSVVLISPWILYSLAYLLASWLLLRVSIRLVRRPER